MCNIHTRIADERFVFGARFSSMVDIIDAIDVLRICAMCFNSAINSGSSEILVWCPDKDTDSFFIFIIFPQADNRIKHDMGRRIYVIQNRLNCLPYNMFQMHRIQTKINRCVQIKFYCA